MITVIVDTLHFCSYLLQIEQHPFLSLFTPLLLPALPPSLSSSPLPLLPSPSPFSSPPPFLLPSILPPPSSPSPFLPPSTPPSSLLPSLYLPSSPPSPGVIQDSSGVVSHSDSQQEGYEVPENFKTLHHLALQYVNQVSKGHSCCTAVAVCFFCPRTVQYAVCL